MVDLFTAARLQRHIAAAVPDAAERRALLAALLQAEAPLPAPAPVLTRPQPVALTRPATPANAYLRRA